MKAIMTLAGLILLLMGANVRAQETELPSAPSEEREVDVELKIPLPGPGMNGYIWGFSATMAVQFNKLVSIDLRGGAMSRDGWSLIPYVTIDAGLVPVIHDRRRGERGWVTQAGASVGYGIDWHTSTSPENNDDYAKEFCQLVTGNLIFKTTHWWHERLGMIFQFRLIGAVSFFSWYEVWEQVYDENDNAEFVLVKEFSGFRMGDQKFGGLQFFMGVAF